MLVGFRGLCAGKCGNFVYQMAVVGHFWQRFLRYIVPNTGFPGETPNPVTTPNFRKLLRTTLPSSTMNNTTTTAPIDQAIANLESQERPNILATAKKFGLVESTLRRRWKGQSVSRREASSTHKQRLTTVQEEALISQINRLTDRGIPPTPTIMRNLAEEMIQSSVGRNWAGEFTKRNQDRLKSLYLRNMDSLRIKSEYAPTFKQFYDQVRSFENITAPNCVAFVPNSQHFF